MFAQKYTVSILNSKWVPLKRNLKLSIVPRRDELIFMDEQYFNVLNVIHKLGDIHDIFVIVDEMQEKLSDSKSTTYIEGEK